MNQIYNKLKTKRRYTRKPTCKDKQGLCEHGKCRCDMAIKRPKLTSKGVKVDHKREQKVVDRLREKAKLENDRENATVININAGIIEGTGYIGEYSKHRLIRKRYERQVWVVLALIVAVTLILSR